MLATMIRVPQTREPKQQTFFSKFWRLRTLRSRHQEIWHLVRTYFLVWRQPLSCCIFTWWKEWALVSSSPCVSCSVMSDSLQPHGHATPLSMGFSKQEYWIGLPFPSPGDLPDPEIEPGSPALQEDSLLSEPPGNHSYNTTNSIIKAPPSWHNHFPKALPPNTITLRIQSLKY